MPTKQIRKGTKRLGKKSTSKSPVLSEVKLIAEKTEFLTPTTTILLASRALVKSRARELPVADASGKIVGRLNKLDVLDYFGGGSKNNIMKKNASSLAQAVNLPIAFIMESEIKTVGKKGKIKDILNELKKADTIFISDGNKIAGKVSDTTVMKIIEGMNFGKVSDCMTKKVVTCTPGYAVLDACEIMVRNGFGEIPVVQEKEIIGIITATDILSYLSAKALSWTYENAMQEHVGEIMTKKVLSVSPKESVKTALEIMLRNNIRALPVWNGKVVGILSHKDIIKSIK